MKKLLLRLGVLMLLFLMPVMDQPVQAATSGNCGTNVRWQLNVSTGTLLVSGYGDMTDISAWSENLDKSLVKHVVIHDSVKSIGGQAFIYFDQLETVKIGSGVTVIDDSAFFSCRNLRSVEMTSGVREIQGSAFAWCSSLESITLPDTVRLIGEGAFMECEKLVYVGMPSQIEEIGRFAFRNCVSLKSIVIPPGKLRLGNQAFKNCSALEEVVLSDGLEWIGEQAFLGCSSLKEVVMPNSVTTVFEQAFQGCASMERLVLSNSLTELREDTFNGCSSLKIVAVPNSVRWIDQRAFRNCSNLETVILARGVGSVEHGAFENCTSLKYVVLDQLEGFRYADFGGNEEFMNAEYCYCLPLDAHRHDFGYVEPRTAECAKDGCTAGVFCNVCGEEFMVSQVIPATGEHSYVEGECTVCGITDPGYTSVPFGFVDVTKNDYFYFPVKWALRMNVTSGVGPTTFGPNNGCTRGQVVTFLWAAAGRPEPESTENPFTDVAESDYYYKPVLWAVENGITGGIAADRFGPNETCTRGQIVTFLWAAQGKPDSLHGNIPFKDTYVGDWFLGPVLWAERNGITGGTGDGMFSPYATCTRGQVVTFLYKVYG